MKLEQLKKRLDKQRPMTTISMRFPVDVLDDLKRWRHYVVFLAISP